MDRDPYENTELPWQEPQQHIYDETPYFTPSRYEWDRQKLRVPTEPKRMAKEQAMKIVGSLRKGVVVAAIVAFGIFSLLTANLVSGHNSWGFLGRNQFPMNQPGYLQDHHGFFHHHNHNRGRG